MSRTYVALLYSIVLTPQKRVVMADLRAMAEGLGYENVRTLVSSGNLVFDAPDTAIADLESRLEAAFPKTFGRHVDIVVRDAAGWLALATANPFPEDADATPDQVAVRVMRNPVPANAEERLRQAASFSRAAPASRLLAAMNHKALGIGTARNWNTVRNLAEMVA